MKFSIPKRIIKGFFELPLFFPAVLISGLIIFSATSISGCVVEEKCYKNEDCESPKICDSLGECVFECVRDEDCGPGFVCEDHRCRLDQGNTEPLSCPEDMVSIDDAYCMDIFEASRPDATQDSQGEDSSVATSREGVLPWKEDENALVQAACEAAGKTLCTPAQWEYACMGPESLVYTYGDTYDPTACNGYDSFGDNQFHLAPTGSFPRCTNEFGTFDLNGNLWEHTKDGDGSTVRGGAYNCGNSLLLHMCRYVPTSWTPSVLGFRCCLVPEQDDENGE